MAKYNQKFKLEVVKEYLKATASYNAIVKKYKISSKSVVQDWVNSYQLNGEDGLKHRTTKKAYTGDFKFRVIQYRQINGLSYLQTANHFKLHSGSMVSNWQQLYNRGGYAALHKSVVRPSNLPKQSKVPLPDVDVTEREELIRLREEIEYLKMSIEYEKKLEALVQLRLQKTRKKQK